MSRTRTPAPPATAATGTGLELPSVAAPAAVLGALLVGCGVGLAMGSSVGSAVLGCAVLGCAVLGCVVLGCVVLGCAVLGCAVLGCAVGRAVSPGCVGGVGSGVGCEGCGVGWAVGRELTGEPVVLPTGPLFAGVFCPLLS